MDILLRLLFAHIIADFFLQTNKMNIGKNSVNRCKWLYLLCHSLIHAAIAYAIIAQWGNWLIPLIVFFSHFVIDTIKVGLNQSSLTAFILDQMAHVSILFLIAFYETGEILLGNFPPQLSTSNKILTYLTGYILMLKPSSIIINLLLKRWNMESYPLRGLPYAGTWIGILERIMIITFVLTNNVGGIGFLLTAKSIFRFGDLNKAKEIKTTEYVMVGTLTSFTMAILVAYAIRLITQSY
ncbi:DUF3307 domain-containing protein [Segatella maculosa]|uniref:DUF3307 domain-containing protein n=1 Tax=Segatella maculosa TaxID=439703 RepID=UPI0023F276F5|nr:DUF3307 domain-containing protein [Segatella maculosa]